MCTAIQGSSAGRDLSRRQGGADFLRGARAGHINFNDEVSAAMRLADGVLLVVDAAEGALVVTEKVVKQALAEGLPITLLLTKARLGCPNLTLTLTPTLILISI